MGKPIIPSKEISKNRWPEFGLEFLAGLLLALYQLGVEQMGLPHSFTVGLVCWVLFIGIAIRMFWIFPPLENWSRKVKAVTIAVFVIGFVFLERKPVLNAYEKESDDQAKQQTPRVVLRVADYERLPLVVGEKMRIHLHLKAKAPRTLKVHATCSPIWVETPSGPENFAPRKAFEDDLWKQAIAAEPKLPSEPLQIPPQMNDFWLPLETTEVLTQELI